MSEGAAVPEGFRALRRGSSRFLSALGTLYVKGEGKGAVIGLRIEEKQARFRSLGFWAGLLVSGVTSTYRLFGRNTLSARVNRWSTLGSILVSIARFLFRLFG